ncbi:MAG: hypothetical protein QOC92_1462 [Acidimicrobiaceae bacterium]
MRISVVDNGHRGRARLYVWMLDKLGGGAPDVIKTLMHRPEFFGRYASRSGQQVMRGPSPWSIGDRELFAAYTSRLNQCPF